MNYGTSTRSLDLHLVAFLHVLAIMSVSLI